MSEKKETEGKATGEMPGNDSMKKASGLVGDKFFPFSNVPMGIMGGRNVSLTVSARGGIVPDYGVTSTVGGEEPPKKGQKCLP